MTYVKYQLANNATAKLIAGISSPVQTFQLETWRGDLFPSFPWNTYIWQLVQVNKVSLEVVKREIVTVTNKSWDTFTVVRATWTCPIDDNSTTQVQTAYEFIVDDGYDTYFQMTVNAEVERDIQNGISDLQTQKLDVTSYLSGANLYDDSTTWSDAYLVALPLITSYAQIDWQIIRVKVDVSNTDSATLQINALWAKPITKFNWIPLTSWDIISWNIMVVAWNNTDDAFELIQVIDQSSSAVTPAFTSSFPIWEDFASGNSWFLERNATVVYNSNTSENSTTPPSITWWVIQARWYKMLANLNLTVSSITKNASSTATRAIIADSAWVTLATATFIGNTAIFSTPYYFNASTVFRILCDNSGASYTATLWTPTIARTNVNYTLWSQAWSDDASNGWNIDSIVTNIITTTNQNICDVSGNTRVSHIQIWSWVASNQLKLLLAKVLAPSADLKVRIETDNSGVPSGTLIDPNATATITPGSITTTVTDYTVTLAWSIIIPLYTKVHIVLFVGTYWSETINWTNYYRTAYGATHTTTRNDRIWNGSVWWSTNNRFYYAWGSLFLDQIMSKADATYSYKVNKLYFAKETKVSWEVCKFDHTAWLSEVFSWQTIDADLYQTNTPGVVWTTVGTNKYYVGKVRTPSRVELRPTNMAPVSITLTATNTPWQNTLWVPVQVSISWWTFTNIAISRDNATWYTVWTTATVIYVMPTNYFRVTYTVLPTVVYMPC